MIHTSREALAVLVLAIAALGGACSSAKAVAEAEGTGCAASSGFSGMARAGENSYLAVHDAKGTNTATRLTRIDVLPKGRCRSTPVTVATWRDADGPGNDLESVCAMPGRPDEFIVAESGTWNDRYGRLFHLRLTGATAEVIGAYQLPSFVGGRETVDGDDFEGLACAALPDGNILLILGERGGSMAYPRGLLRWGEFDPAARSLSWRDGGRATLDVVAPGPWATGTVHRDIADLHVDDGGSLWAVATAEDGKGGPFRSLIYRVGRLTGDRTRPVEVVAPVASWIIDGFKVEALAAPAAAIEASVFSIGTEDENYGGVWRPLFTSTVTATTAPR